MSEAPQPGELPVPAGAAGQRLDAWLGQSRREKSRAQWKELIDAGLLTVDGRAVKSRHALKGGEKLAWTEPAPPPDDTRPQELPLSILHEDEHLIVVDKAHGMVVHPAVGNPDGTLVNALLHHTGGRLARIGAPLRPGIVHRLDRDTSGCLVVAKSDAAHHHLVRQFAGRTMLKLYLAAAQGIPAQPAGTIFTHIARHPVNRQKMAVCDPPHGKPSITDYRVLATRPAAAPLGPSALLLCHLHTGRTHQIRVHCQHLGHSLLGDPVYARPARQPWQGRLLLHAWHLAFIHPADDRRLAFTAAVPPEFAPWTEGLDLPGLVIQASA